MRIYTENLQRGIKNFRASLRILYRCSASDGAGLYTRERERGAKGDDCLSEVAKMVSWSRS